MRLYIPKQGNLFVVELTEEALGNITNLNCYALTASVIDVLSTCLLVQEQELPSPKTLFGYPLAELIDMLKNTAAAFYIQEETIEAAISKKRLNKHIFLASLFQYGFVSLDALIAPKPSTT